MIDVSDLKVGQKVTAKIYHKLSGTTAKFICLVERLPEPNEKNVLVRRMLDGEVFSVEPKNLLLPPWER